MSSFCYLWTSPKWGGRRQQFSVPRGLLSHLWVFQASLLPYSFLFPPQPIVSLLICSAFCGGGRGRGSVSEGQHTSVGLTEALPGSLSFVRGGRRWPLLSRCGRREERLDTGEKNRRKIYHTVNIILPTTWLFTLLVILQLSIKNTDLCCFNDFITILFIQQTFPTECHVLFAEVLLILWWARHMVSASIRLTIKLDKQNKQANKMIHR